MRLPPRAQGNLFASVGRSVFAALPGRGGPRRPFCASLSQVSFVARPHAPFLCRAHFPPTTLAEVIAAKGAEHTTVEELVKEITPKGRATVPEAVKGDLLEKIRTFLKKN